MSKLHTVTILINHILQSSERIHLGRVNTDAEIFDDFTFPQIAKLCFDYNAFNATIYFVTNYRGKINEECHIGLQHFNVRLHLKFCY